MRDKGKGRQVGPYEHDHGDSSCAAGPGDIAGGEKEDAARDGLAVSSSAHRTPGAATTSGAAGEVGGGGRATGVPSGMHRTLIAQGSSGDTASTSSVRTTGDGGGGGGDEHSDGTRAIALGRPHPRRQGVSAGRKISLMMSGDAAPAGSTSAAGPSASGSSVTRSSVDLPHLDIPACSRAAARLDVRPPTEPPSASVPVPSLRGDTPATSTTPSATGDIFATSSSTTMQLPTMHLQLPQSLALEPSRTSASANTGATPSAVPVPTVTPVPSYSTSAAAAGQESDPISHPDAGSDTPPSDLSGAILPLLRCPLCTPPRLLHAPITLHCGHTVCAEHLPSPSSSRTTTSLSASSSSPSAAASTVDWSADTTWTWTTTCPIPSCTRPSPQDAPTFIHPDARVRFVRTPASPGPAPDGGAQERQRGSPSDRDRAPVDVTVKKILEMVTRVAVDALSERVACPPLLDEHEERTDSEGENDADDKEVGDDFTSGEEDGQGKADVPMAGPSRLLHPQDQDHELRQRRTHRRSSSPPLLPFPPRPRKRRRLQPRRPRGMAPTSASPQPSLPESVHRGPGALPNANAGLLQDLKTELGCEICFALMWQPVTTPCQHTFCEQCLLRALDHSDTCPLCREKLPGFVYFQEHSSNKLVLSIILKAFPEAYAERGAAIRAEETNSRLDTPIFVCQLSFPGMPTYLHLYEPRYRLMLRRCLASPHPCFGMIPPPRQSATASSPSNEFGTMLEIRNVQMLPDGRSLVETWGTWRFRIMERGVLDGYMVGRVERIDDWEEYEEIERRQVEEPCEASTSSAASLPSVRGSVRAPTNEELMAVCRDFVEELKEGTPWVGQHLNTRYVAMPTDPAEFSFWMAPLIPIEDHEKAKLLPIRSPRLRLRLIVHWIEQLKSQWARSYASASRWQVVLWWLCALLTPWGAPMPYQWAFRRRRRAMKWVVRVILFALLVWVQVWMHWEERRKGMSGSAKVGEQSIAVV